MVSLSGPTTASATEGLNGAGNVTVANTVVNTEPGGIAWLAGGYTVLSAPSFGTLTITQNTAFGEGGYTWSFVFDSDDPALDGLDRGESLDVTFTVRVFDRSWGGVGAPSTVNGTQVVDTHQVTITIFGENEVCFTRGTELLTEHGPKRIEELRVGDLLETRDHGLKPIRWIGMSKVSEAQRRGNSSLEPIRIKAGAISKGVPQNDLCVSPQHRILIDGAYADMLLAEPAVFAAAKNLVNGVSIKTCGQDFDALEYWHVALEDHDVIYANGCPTESLLLGDMAVENMSSDQLREIETLFPGLLGGQHEIAYPEAKAHEAKVLSWAIVDGDIEAM